MPFDWNDKATHWQPPAARTREYTDAQKSIYNALATELGYAAPFADAPARVAPPAPASAKPAEEPNPAADLDARSAALHDQIAQLQSAIDVARVRARRTSSCAFGIEGRENSCWNFLDASREPASASASSKVSDASTVARASARTAAPS